jgi:hypothetical protein
MPITTDQFDDLVANANISFREGYEEVPNNARQLYDIDSNMLETTEHQPSLDGFGFARRKFEGDSYAVGQPRAGYSMTLTKSRIGLKASVTWEMRTYDKYREIDKKMRGIGMSTAMRIELDLTHLLTFGLQGTTYTNMDGETVNTVTGDALQIFSASHTVTGSASTFSNYNGTTALGRTGIDAAMGLFTSMINNQDQMVVPSPTHIITSNWPAVVNKVQELIGNPTNPENANNVKNVYNGKLQHIILPYLATTNLGAPTTTGRFYYILADLAHKDAIAEFSEYPTFTAPTPGGNGEDFDTDDWDFKTSAAYAYGILDPRWLVGTAATAVA